MEKRLKMKLLTFPIVVVVVVGNAWFVHAFNLSWPATLAESVFIALGLIYISDEIELACR